MLAVWRPSSGHDGGVLRIERLQGSRLHVADRCGTSDPYAVISYRDQRILANVTDASLHSLRVSCRRSGPEASGSGRVEVDVAAIEQHLTRLERSIGTAWGCSRRHSPTQSSSVRMTHNLNR